MKAFHRTILGDPFWQHSTWLRNLNETKRAVLIGASVVFYLGSTQRTRPIKKYR